MPAHQPGVPPARAVPAGITRCRHSIPACQRLMHSRQHANKAGGRQHANKAGGKKHAGLSSGPPASKQGKHTQRPEGRHDTATKGITHRPQACSFCGESLQILCQNQRNRPVFSAKRFDHFFSKKKQNNFPLA